jgi:hypothetical protein
MYLASVKVPRVPSPSEKLPATSIRTGLIVRRPTMTISAGVRTVSFPWRPFQPAEEAVVRVDGDGDLAPFRDVRGGGRSTWSSASRRSGSPFIHLSDEEQRLHLAAEDVAAARAGHRYPDELGGERTPAPRPRPLPWGFSAVIVPIAVSRARGPESDATFPGSGWRGR